MGVQGMENASKRHCIKSPREVQFPTDTRKSPFQTSVYPEPKRQDEFRGLPEGPETVTPGRALWHVWLNEAL
eukprot:6462059-Amphidinium_carterae.1